MQYFTFLLSLINPIYSSIFALIESTKKNTGILPIISFSLIFAVTAFCIDPSESYDLYRHYQRIDYIKTLNFKEILELKSTNYLIFDAYSWLLSQVGLPKQLLTTTAVFVTYLSVLLVYNNVKKHNFQNSSIKLRLITFLIMWFSIDFVFLSSGIRNLTANGIVFFSTYYLLYYNKLPRFFILSTIAFFIHPASILPTILSLVSFKLYKISQYGKYLALLGIISIVFNKAILILINFIDTLLRFVPGYSSVYLDPEGIWGGGYLKSASFNEFIAGYILYRLPSYVGILYMAFIKPRKSDPLYLLLCFFVSLLGFTFNFFTIYQRLSSFFLHLFALFIILDYQKNPNSFKLKYIYLYFISLVIHSISAIYAHADYLYTAYEVIYTPLPFLIFRY